MAYQRVFVIVLDSVGTGQAEDAARFDDVGADTLGHVGEYYQGKLQLPNLGQMGLSNLRGIPIKGSPRCYSSNWRLWTDGRSVSRKG